MAEPIVALIFLGLHRRDFLQRKEVPLARCFGGEPHQERVLSAILLAKILSTIGSEEGGNRKIKDYFDRFIVDKISESDLIPNWFKKLPKPSQFMDTITLITLILNRDEEPAEINTATIALSSVETGKPTK